MADVIKYALPINVGTMYSDLRSHFSFLRTKKTATFAYGFMFAFIAVTVFLAFSPSSNSSSPWFTNIFSISSVTSSSTPSTSGFSHDSNRSHFSSIFYHFFPNSSQQAHNTTSPSSSVNITRSHNSTFEPPNLESPILKNQTQIKETHDKVGVLKTNHTRIYGSRIAQNQTQNKLLNQARNDVLKAPVAVNQTANKAQKSSSELNKEPSVLKNQTHVNNQPDKVEVLNQGNAEAPKHPVTTNSSVNSSLGSSSGGKNSIGNVEKNIAEKGVIKNFTSSLSRKQNNETNKGVLGKQGNENLVESLLKCDLYDGNWVRDESYPLYKPGSCLLIDEQFNCFLNGRPDNGYHKFKWKPQGCILPRLNASHMLEILRGKRMVFVGDSLNRNMWESLVCILRNSVNDKKKVYEVSGRHHFRSEASYAFIFEDYKCSVEFFVSPFLVEEWEIQDKNGTKKDTLRLDLIENFADKYKTADIIVFNTGHWWTHEKTSKGKDYYQEGSHVYSELNVIEAFRKALTTWARWVDANINSANTLVFFRGYSASHFSGGQWNSGGQCDHETEPIKDEAYLSPYPDKMTVLEKVLRGMKTHVSYMNITRMTDFRKDGHPSMYRKQHMSEVERRLPLRFQDCSHWCLPGVPDTWNEILYTEILRSLMQRQQNQQKRP